LIINELQKIDNEDYILDEIEKYLSACTYTQLYSHS